MYDQSDKLQGEKNKRMYCSIGQNATISFLRIEKKIILNKLILQNR